MAVDSGGLFFGKSESPKPSPTSGKPAGYYSRVALLSCVVAVLSAGGAVALIATLGQSNPESRYFLLAFLVLFFLAGLGAGLGLADLFLGRDRHRDRLVPFAGLLLNVAFSVGLALLILARATPPPGSN